MTKTYTTVQGDMWDSIAYRELGSTAHTDALLSLNAQYADIYIFPAGITLALPDAVVTAPGGAPPWKVAAG